MFLFTEADSTSAFVRKGKEKAFEIFLNNAKYQHASERLWTSFNVTDSLFECLEEFACRLYGQSCSNINQARYRLFWTNSFKERSLASGRVALLQHTYWANYQTAIDRRALEPFMNVPTPPKRCWIISSNEILIGWVTRNQAPIELMKHPAGKC